MEREKVPLSTVLINDKVQCTNCKCWRIQNDYIGKSSDIVKRCLKCRNKDSKRKALPENRNKTNKRQNDKKYYQTHRIKKREENEEEFLKHNAEIAKIWRNNNKEHLTKWRTKNFASRFGSIKQQAQKKNIIWNDNMTDELCYELMTSYCFYCNFNPQETLNGIDRLDSSGDYEMNNCVTCCKTCNFMKTCLDPFTFIKRCKHISLIHNDIGQLYIDSWRDIKSASYNSYSARALKKNLDFELTLENYNEIISRECYYCNKQNTKYHKNGIDRKNNNLGYFLNNCVTCCGECNYMKSKLTDIQFINQCKIISNREELSDYFEIFEKIPICKNSLQHTKKDPIEKTKIVITKQQPNQEIIYKIYEELPKEVKQQREYIKGSNLPKYCNFDIPKYCHYISETKSKGDGFCVGRLHPKQNGKDWTTTKSKKVSIQEKFKQMMSYLNNKEYQVKQDIQITKKSTAFSKQTEAIFSDEIYIEIFKLKNVKNTTTEDASKYIKEKFQKYIKRDVISKIWKRETLPPTELQQTQEYQDMIKNVKLRTKRCKFTDEEVNFMKSEKSKNEISLGQISKLFQEKFNKTVTTTYISKLKI